jgi:hypothetical protein
MSKLELPADVANKVVGMLKVKKLPKVMLIFECETYGSFVKILEGSLNPDECKSMKISRQTFSHYGPGYEFGTIENQQALDDLVYFAMSNGFEFQCEADRERWRNHKNFEMYRVAVREFA